MSFDEKTIGGNKFKNLPIILEAKVRLLSQFSVKIYVWNTPQIIIAVALNSNFPGGSQGFVRVSVQQPCWSIPRVWFLGLKYPLPPPPPSF